MTRVSRVEAASPRKDLLSFVENALSAFSTKLNKSGSSLRREQASTMASRQTL